MQRRFTLKALTAAVALAGITALPAHAQTGGTIKVGILHSLSGTMAILLVEQYYDFAEELADDYLVMQRGEFIARGPGTEMQVNGVRQMVAI